MIRSNAPNLAGHGPSAVIRFTPAAHYTTAKFGKLISQKIDLVNNTGWLGALGDVPACPPAMECALPSLHADDSRRPFLSPVRTISISRLRPIAIGPARAGQKGCASAYPSGLAAAIAGRFRLGIEVGICFAPTFTSGGGGLALLIARKAAVAARPANLAALDAIGTRRCRHRGRARHRHRQKCPTHRLCPVQSFVATRHPRQQSVNSRSLDDHHKFIGWRVNAASPVSG